MRIDDRSRYESQLQSIQSNSSRAFELQQEIASGSRILKPSDEPGGYQRKEELTGRIQGLQSDQQFLRQQELRLDRYDSSVGSLVENLRRARTIVQRASNSGTDPAAQQGMRSEIDNLIQSSLNTLNEETGGRFLFGGSQAHQPPFAAQSGGGSVHSVHYQGDSHFPGIPLPDGQQLKIPLDGKSLTQVDDVELFQTLVELRDSIQGEAIEAEPHLSRLEKMEDHLLDKRVQSGAASKYLSQLQTQLADKETESLAELSSLSEADLPGSITELLQNQVVQQSTYSVVAQQSRLSLVDYLR
jgi:flagellar hook-associated protein 3 FlgL